MYRHLLRWVKSLFTAACHLYAGYRTKWWRVYFFVGVMAHTRVLLTCWTAFCLCAAGASDDSMRLWMVVSPDCTGVSEKKWFRYHVVFSGWNKVTTNKHAHTLHPVKLDQDIPNTSSTRSTNTATLHFLSLKVQEVRDIPVGNDFFSTKLLMSIPFKLENPFAEETTCNHKSPAPVQEVNGMSGLHLPLSPLKRASSLSCISQARRGESIAPCPDPHFDHDWSAATTDWKSGLWFGYRGMWVLELLSIINLVFLRCILKACTDRSCPSSSASRGSTQYPVWKWIDSGSVLHSTPLVKKLWLFCNCADWLTSIGRYLDIYVWYLCSDGFSPDGCQLWKLSS